MTHAKGSNNRVGVSKSESSIEVHTDKLLGLMIDIPSVVVYYSAWPKVEWRYGSYYDVTWLPFSGLRPNEESFPFEN